VLPLRIRNHIDALAGFQLRRIVRAGQYDIVHFHTARAHTLSPWLQGLKTKRIVTRRMDYPLRKGWATRLLYLHNTDWIIAISKGVQAELLEGGVPLERLRVIPSGIDTKKFLPNPAAQNNIRIRYNIPLHLPLVLSVGALVERKGHNFLLSAAYQLKEQGYDLRYLICGEGGLRSDLEAQSRALGLTQEVRFIGFCPEVPELQAAADYFVHVPLHEGLGVAVIEALAAGLPVIASRVGGIPELIEDHKTGILIPPKDVTSLVAALSSLLSHKQFARHLGVTGQAFVRSRLDVNIMAQTNEALYIELLADIA
jgi:glycosyltransferase involved in cell wall biosynthesis